MVYGVFVPDDRQGGISQGNRHIEKLRLESVFPLQAAEFGLHMAGRDYNQCVAEAYPETGSCGH